MPATRSDLINLAMAGNAGLFRYATSEPLETVLAPGFFNPAATMLRVDDVVLVVGAKFGVAPLRVAKVTGKTVTVQLPAAPEPAEPAPVDPPAEPTPA